MEALSGVVVERLDAQRDKRGEFVELFSESRSWRTDYRLPAEGFDPRTPRFKEDDVSINNRGVLRGLHGDGVTWKLVTCISGRIFFIIADPSSKAYTSVVLTDENRLQVLVPPVYAIGYESLTQPAIVHYKQSEVYGTAKQFTLRWNDPRYGIEWPIPEPILSDRDAQAPFRS